MIDKDEVSKKPLPEYKYQMRKSTSNTLEKDIKFLKGNEVTGGCFLIIESASDNIRFICNWSVAVKKSVDKQTYKWIRVVLQIRIMKTNKPEKSIQSTKIIEYEEGGVLRSLL